MKLTLVIAAILYGCAAAFGQSDDLATMQRIVAEQGSQIEELRAQLAEIRHALGISSNAVPNIPASVTREKPEAITNATVSQPSAPPAIAGFLFGGDFRLRLDAAVRGASAQASGLQNIRGRYRLRLNAEREVAPDLTFHMQLSTGAVHNGITLDQDFAGGVSRHPFLISEGYLDFHPHSNISIRAGKQEEVYADNSRFFWDDDVRLNGFNERLRFGKIEFRGGQYFFINPNVFAVAAGSPLTLAGVETGKMARASQMFHQGMTVDAPFNNRWKHQVTTDIQLYRNPNLIALTSKETGVTATVAPGIGLTVAAPAPGVGNATTSPSSAILFARHYQIARVVYRLDAAQFGGHPKMPITWMLQSSRNMGASVLRDAVMASVSIGRTAEKGDVRGLYMFAIKDANSMISQLTDDDLGTGTGVNIATHHLRLDYMLRPNLSFQNLLFLQTERRSSNPASSFFVPLGRETPRTWRYLGQISVRF